MIRFVLGAALVWVVAVHSVAGAAVTATVLAVMYWYSISRRPMRPCRLCGGGGADKSRWFWRYAYGECLCCHGRKGHVRWGVRLLQRKRYAALRGQS